MISDVSSLGFVGIRVGNSKLDSDSSGVFDNSRILDELIENREGEQESAKSSSQEQKIEEKAIKPSLSPTADGEQQVNKDTATNREVKRRESSYMRVQRRLLSRDFAATNNLQF